MKTIMSFGGLTAEPGQKVQGMAPLYPTAETFPITLINGCRPGRTILISSGIHGSEYPGIQTAIEMAAEIRPENLSGQLVILHPVNVAAFYEKSCYISPVTGTNLNRNFPGDEKGPLPLQISHYLLHHYGMNCDFVLDLHGGDLHEALPPYVYYPGIGDADVIEASRRVSELVHCDYIVKSQSTTGFYNACAIAGTPAVLIERGSSGQWIPEEVVQYKSDVYNILRYLGAIEGEVVLPEKPAMKIQRAAYLDSPAAGCWYPLVKLHDPITTGQKIGEIRDFFGKLQAEIHAEYDGVILYMKDTLSITKKEFLIAYGTNCEAD